MNPSEMVFAMLQRRSMEEVAERCGLPVAAIRLIARNNTSDHSPSTIASLRAGYEALMQEGQNAMNFSAYKKPADEPITAAQTSPDAKAVMVTISKVFNNAQSPWAIGVGPNYREVFIGGTHLRVLRSRGMDRVGARFLAALEPSRRDGGIGYQTGEIYPDE